MKHDYDEEDDEMYRQKEKELKDQIKRIKEVHKEVKEQLYLQSEKCYEAVI